MSNGQIDFIRGITGFSYGNSVFDKLYFDTLLNGRDAATAYGTLITLLQLWKTDAYQFILQKSGATTLDDLQDTDKCCTMLIEPSATATSTGTTDGYHCAGHRAFYRGFFLIKQLSTEQQHRLLCQTVPCLVGRLATIQSECRRNGILLATGSTSVDSSTQLSTDAGNSSGLCKDTVQRRSNPTKVRNNSTRKLPKEKGSSGEPPIVEITPLETGTCDRLCDDNRETKDLTKPKSRGAEKRKRGTACSSQSNGESSSSSGEENESGGIMTSEVIPQLETSMQVSQSDFDLLYPKLSAIYLKAVSEMEDPIERMSCHNNIVLAWSILGRVDLLKQWKKYGVDPLEGKVALGNAKYFIEDHVESGIQ